MSEAGHEPITRRAHAKINVFLRVLGGREDGFHDIESVVLPLSLHDLISVRPTEGPNPTVSIDGVPEHAARVPTGEDNLVLAAVRALSRATGASGSFHIEIDKRIPVAAGLGGGSADAAATLLACSEHLAATASGRPDPGTLAAIAVDLGSDVPAMMASEPTQVGGRGEVLTPVHAAPTWWVLRPFAVAVSAADAYAWWDREPVTGPDPGATIAALETGDASALGGGLFNDLQVPVAARHPEVSETVEAFVAAGALGALMSGSGPTVAALARDPLEAERIAGAVPGSIVVHGGGHELGAGARTARSIRAAAFATERLRAEPTTPGDAGALFAVLDDERLHRFIGGRPDTLDELRSRLATWAAGGSGDSEVWCNWVVRASDEVVGTLQATIRPSREDFTIAAVAWVIGSRHQGKGYATEAARGLIGWLRGEGVAIAEAHIHPDHVASATVAERCGLRATDEVDDDGEVIWRGVVAGVDQG